MKNVFEQRYFLVAGDADAQLELPLTTLVDRIIEVASLHANALGFGHTAMAPMQLGWVLSRLSVGVRRYPSINAGYTLRTWITEWNRRYSERCFELTDESGEVLGYARTVWMVIDTHAHTGTTTERLPFEPQMIAERDCPLAQPSRIPLLKPSDAGVEVFDYTYLYTDIDVYRHVNTVKHIRTLMDTLSLERMDRERITRFDIAFMHEGNYGSRVNIMRRQNEDISLDFTVACSAEGAPIIRARMELSPREEAHT